MRSKWIKVLAAAIVIVMALPAAGSAAPLEPDKKCSLKVEAVEPTQGNEEMVNDLAAANLVYDLYKVADLVNDGGYYTYKFTGKFEELRNNEFLKTKYNGLVDEKGQLLVPRDGGEISGSLWEDLAQEAAKLALNTGNAQAEGTGAEEGGPEETGNPFQAGKGLPIIGEVIGTEVPGPNAFTGTDKVLQDASLGIELPNTAYLQQGLYLLIARGRDMEAYIAKEYAVKAPDTDTEAEGTDSPGRLPEREEKIATVAHTDRYVYTFAPRLISLPTKAPDADGKVSTANNGDWIYNPTVYLKPEQHLRYGYLEIVKDLLGYESFAGQSEEAVFVFQVEATLNGVSVYSDVKTMIFTGAGEQRVLIDKIPVGATVTVTEVYSGASYTLEKIEQGYHAVEAYPDSSIVYTPAGNIDTREVTGAVIEANRVVSVKFTNNYDHRQTGGHGVINHYEYGENGWANDVEQQWTNPAQSNPPQGNENS